MPTRVDVHLALEQARAWSLLVVAGLKNTWRSLNSGIDGQGHAALVLPSTLALAVLMGWFVERTFLVHLRSTVASDPASEAVRWMLSAAALMAAFHALGAAADFAGARVPDVLEVAARSSTWVRMAWRVPYHIASASLALGLALPTGRALADWLGLEGPTVFRIVAASFVLLWSASALGFALAGILEHALRGILDHALRRTRLRGAPLVMTTVAALAVAALATLAALWVRDLPAPALAGMGAIVVGSRSSLLPVEMLWTGSLLAGVTLAACLLRESLRCTPRAGIARRPREWRLGGTSWRTSCALDLRLWCRERQGLALAVLLQLFWIVAFVFCAGEAGAEAKQIGAPIDSGRFQGFAHYLMPIGWAFFATLSFGLTFAGGRQLTTAPLAHADVLWGKFFAAVCFSGLQCLLSSLAGSVIFDGPLLPPGASVILAIFVLACAACFVAGVLVPVDPRRMRAGLGAVSTSMLAIFVLVICLAFVLLPAHEWLEGARSRSFVQVLVAGALSGLVLVGACKAVRTYGLAR